MELYASGFNAWGQLNLNRSSDDFNVQDIHNLTRVFHGGSIEQIQAFLSHTLGRLSRLMATNNIRETHAVRPYSDK